MVDTIQKALCPLRMAYFLFGLGLLRDPLNHLRRCLSVLYICILWSAYAYFTYQLLSVFLNSRRMSEFLAYFLLIVNSTVTSVSVIIAVCAHENLEMCIKKIALVDDTLEELGTPKEYRKMRESAMWLLFVWFGMVCVSITGDALWCMEMYSHVSAVLIPFVIDYCIHINTFTDMIFMFLIRYVGTRLDKINDYILQLSENDKCGLRCTWKKSTVVICCYPDNVKYRVLWTAMHLHLELCRIARSLNYLFGIQITLQMMSYFVILSCMIYIQYNTIMCVEHILANRAVSIKLFFFSSTWLIIFMAKFISINHVCESINTKAQKTKEIIHKLTNLTYFMGARDEICQFILQLSLRPLKISGIHMFYFGYNYIYKFFVQLLTFIIIMIQVNSKILIMTYLSEKYNISCRI